METHLEIERDKRGSIDRIVLDGWLDGANAPKLNQIFDEIFQENRFQIIIDMGKLEYITSPGLRVLYKARKRLRGEPEEKSKNIVFINVKQRLKEVFDLTGFTSIFEVREDFAEGLLFFLGG